MGQSRIPRNVQVGPISSKPVGPSTYAAIASRKPTVIIGKKSSGLKAVNKLSWIFVSRFLPEISKTNVEEYLKDSNLAQFECIELPTKYDTYKSFRIGIPMESLNDVLNSEFWPEGILVKKFYFPRGDNIDSKSKGFLDKPNA